MDNPWDIYPTYGICKLCYIAQYMNSVWDTSGPFWFRGQGCSPSLAPQVRYSLAVFPGSQSLPAPSPPQRPPSYVLKSFRKATENQGKQPTTTTVGSVSNGVYIYIEREMCVHMSFTYFSKYFTGLFSIQFTSHFECLAVSSQLRTSRIFINTLVFWSFTKGPPQKYFGGTKQVQKKIISVWYLVYPAPNSVACLFRFDWNSGFAKI